MAVGITAVQAQQSDNRRSRAIVLDRDTLHVDTLSIAPGSFTLWKGVDEVDRSLYVLDTWKGLLFRKAGAPTDTLIARYRVLPSLLAGPFRHKDTRMMREIPGDKPDPFRYIPGQQNQDPLGISGLNKSGSISRGVLFGNNQDLSVNSSLNLELSGRLTDKIGVLASITDNSIPVQAGGNTAELQDFDRVFIKLFDDRQELIAGDLVLQRPNSHFITYLKKTKGLSYATRIGADTTKGAMLGIGAAISKGKFARNVIQGIEGVQGPYRLTAEDAGTFLVVLSGTERVFIDGLLLDRGQENDYVIDYNTAQITFTARRLITKDRRITVEFQYSDKNFARSLVRLTSDIKLGRTDLHANLYTEQDHKNQSLQQSLSDEEKLVLAEAGDDPSQAVVPGVDSVAFSNDEILYALIDSNGFQNVLLYSTSPDSARYRASFSFVGAGKGDYVQSGFTPLGRTFRWVEPQVIGGVLVHQGDYAPVRLLIAPRAQQVASIGAAHRISRESKVWGEVAWSNDDRNTFSTVGDADDQGYAVSAGVSQGFRLGSRDTTMRLVISTDNEWVGRTFRPVERYRPVEFERNWNLLGQPGTTALSMDRDQVLIGARIGLQSLKLGTADLGTQLFTLEEKYQGYRQSLVTDLRPGKYRFQFTGSLLTADARTTRSNFIRHKARVERNLKVLVLGFADEQENNRFRNDSTATLQPGSYEFFDWETYVRSADTSKVQFKVGGGQRQEKALRSGLLVNSTEATAYNASFKLTGDPRRKLGASFIYRRLRILDSTVTAQKPEDTWLARVEQGMSVWKGALTWDLFYEFGSGLEQKREFVYLQVPSGQGTHVWIDYNNNGVKELNEFEVASFGYEADYIRVFTPTSEFVRTYNNQLSASAEVRPVAVWADRKGFLGFLSKWSDLASFRSDRKTSSSDLAQAIDPFRIDPLDTMLLAFSGSVNNTVYYDRSGPKWGADHTHRSDRNKSLLTNGYETRVRENDQIHFRMNVTTWLTAEVEVATGRTTNASDLLSGRNYAIDDRSTKPKLTWQPNTRLRLSAQFKYTDRKNRVEFGGERAEVRDAGLEFRFNSVGKGSIQVNGNLVSISYEGQVNSSMGNEILSGLKPGVNLTWSAIIQRRLSDHLQVDLTYNGRHSEGSPVIHVGGAQVRAFF